MYWGILFPHYENEFSLKDIEGKVMFIQQMFKYVLEDFSTVEQFINNVNDINIKLKTINEHFKLH